MLIRRAEIPGRGCLDVRLAHGRIVELLPELARDPGEPLLDANGGALLPGLHDHHIHLFALARAASSVRCGPPEVRTRDELARALRETTPVDGWVRGIGYHEVVAGELDRAGLDALAPDRPVRIQHRTGALWMLNSAGVRRLELERHADLPGVERDARGRVSGRLLRLDGWLREQLVRHEPLAGREMPRLRDLSRRLASYGVTGLTDATVGNSGPELEAFVGAVDRGELRQRLLVMGAPDLPALDHPSVQRGAVKIVLVESDLPGLDELERTIVQAHARGRSVAIHCVTRAELVLAGAVLASAGCRPGDRIEHASIAPPDVMAQLSELPLCVVTQPGFIRERGDAYRVDVEPRDRPWLYRCRGFLAASVALGGSTDAPFGDPDPWRAMRAATERRTESGATLGGCESLTPEQALELFTGPATAPGSVSRRVEVGAPADLCLLDRSWTRAREALSARTVVATIRAGSLIWQRD